MQAKTDVQMRKMKMFCAVLVALLLLPLSVLARDIAPVVSGEWLEKNLSSSDMVIVDIRKDELYKAGHVPNSLSAFYGNWVTKRDNISNELLDAGDMFDLLGSLGITAKSKVVIVGSVTNAVDQCLITRVAWTLVYAGVKNVALLDGGIEKWRKDKRAVSTDVAKAQESKYKGDLNKNILVSKEQLLSSLGKAIVVDTRPPEQFFGIEKSPVVAKFGHLKGAVLLPSPGWILDKEGMTKKTEELAAIAEGVVGNDHSKEIITYCNTGVFASGWWYFLSEVLGYKDVRLYDGSMEELTKDPNAPILKYTWK